MVSSKELVGLGVQGKPWGEIGDTEKKLSKKPSSSAFVEMEASQPTGPLSGCSEAAVFICSSTLKKRKIGKLAVVCTKKKILSS